MRLAALLLVALAGTPALATDPAPGAAAEGAPSLPVPAIEKTVKAKKVADLFQGVWRIQLNADQQRQLETMRVALDPATSPEDLDRLKLTDEERAGVDALRAILDLDPERAKAIRVEQKQMLDAMDQLTLTVTDGSMTTQLPGGENVSATYTVQDTANNRLVLSVTADEQTRRMSVHFVHADLVEMHGEGPEPMRMARVIP